MARTALEKINDAIKRANLHLTLEDRGGWLSLRGVFPPRPDSGKTEPYQQRLPLKIANNPRGCVLAKDKAFEIRGLLNQGKFDWNPYLKEEQQPETIRAWIEALERDYLANGGKLQTWQGDYLNSFKKIADWDKGLNVEALRGIINGIDASTRTRNRVVFCFAKLCDFAGFEHDLRRLRGSYSAFHPVNPRDLPSDKQIADIFNSIKNPQWKNAFALQAIYGLRNYEVFRLDFSEFPIVFCQKGKTDEERYIFPIYPEWADSWLDPDNLSLPDCNGDNQALGDRVTHAFKRLGIPFSPYNLRHCFARRAFECDLAIESAARLMGHRVDVHERIYQKWIDRDTFKRNYDRMMNLPDRQKPPT